MGYNADMTTEENIAAAWSSLRAHCGDTIDDLIKPGYVFAPVNGSMRLVRTRPDLPAEMPYVTASGHAGTVPALYLPEYAESAG